jgi:hypothetical protein
MWNQIFVVSDYEPLSIRRFGEYTTFMQNGKQDITGQSNPFAGKLKFNDNAKSPKFADLLSIRYFVKDLCRKVRQPADYKLAFKQATYL